jgi:hypothetical protein|tara:strand:- start:43 stop:1113 length:1071 start_codon:yes stop_codon:yes gene_type:complete
MADNRSISYGIGLSDQQVNAMLNSDVPEIRKQAQDYIDAARTQQEEKPSFFDKVKDFFSMGTAGASEIDLPPSASDYSLQSSYLPNQNFTSRNTGSYLGNGIYDLLDVAKASANPQINYDGLYQDPASSIATSNLFKAMQPGFEYMDPSSLAQKSSGADLAGNVPTDFDRRSDFRRYFDNKPLTSSLASMERFRDFNPRIGISPTSGIMGSSNIDLSNLPANMGVANEADVDEDFIEEDKNKKSGLGRLMDIIRNLNFSGNPTQRFTPGFNYQGLNQSMINDAYDPITGTTRFTRAVPGSFRSFRTLKDYFDSKKNKAPTSNNAPTSSGGGDGGGNAGGEMLDSGMTTGQHAAFRN